MGHEHALPLPGRAQLLGQVNEFLWESTCPDAFLARLLREHGADLLLCTHTGLPWQRRLPPDLGGGMVVNVGAIGRPANDGRTEVWYALFTVGPGGLKVELCTVPYDHERLAFEIKCSPKALVNYLSKKLIKLTKVK